MAKFISRSEINMLIAAILRAGITSKELTLSDDTQKSLSVPLPLTLSIKGSHFYFEIDHSWRSYHVKFFPSLKPAAADYTLHEDIKSISDEVSGWAIRVAKELSEPDPWSLLGKSRLPQPELFDKKEENEKFNERELRTVKESLQEIRRFLVTEMKPDAKHLAAIDER